MNTYRKMANGEWAVAMRTKGTPGDVVDVTLRDGRTRRVTLGPWLSTAKIEPRDGEPFFLHFFRPAPDAQRETAVVGDLAPMIAMFDRAARHLKFPAVVITVEGLQRGVRVSRAGPGSRFPGSINVVSEDSRSWFGRITLDGRFAPGSNLPTALTEPLLAALRAFAADPVRVASEYGRLTGRCCFCRLALKDERSTSAGYGKQCAENYGLQWGARGLISWEAEPCN